MTNVSVAAVACIAGVLIGCGSSAPASGGSTSGGPSDAGSYDGPAVPTTCTDVAADICNRASSCSANGACVTRDSLQDLVSIVWQSVAFCETSFATACGPNVPQNDNPRVPDPVACGQQIGAATCVDGALLLPSGCGGT